MATNEVGVFRASASVDAFFILGGFMKKFFSIISLLVFLSLFVIPANAVTGFQNFTTVYEFTSDRFSDVSSSDWYYDSVSVSYSLGLVKGVSETQYNPNGNVSLAETIALACRLFSTYNGDGYVFEQGTPWYQVF